MVVVCSMARLSSGDDSMVSLSYDEVLRGASFCGWSAMVDGWMGGQMGGLVGWSICLWIDCWVVTWVSGLMTAEWLTANDKM